MNKHRPQLSVAINLTEIFNLLCPACKSVLVDHMAGKAGEGPLREAFRASLERQPSPATAQGPQDPPQP